MKWFALSLLSVCSVLCGSEIKAVIFDCGGVIIQHDHKEVVRYISDELKIPAKTVQETLHKEIADVAIGKERESCFWSRYANQNGGTLPCHFMDKATADYRANLKQIPGMIDLVEGLQAKGYMTPMLTSTIPTHAMVLSEEGIYCHFHPLFLSFQIGMNKPSSCVYRYVCRYIGLCPDQCVMIDDNKKNVEGAREAGLHAIHFTTLESLKAELAKLGVE